MTKYAPHTSTEAAARAKAKVGKSNQVGMCAHEVIVNIFGIPGPWKWGGNGSAWAINYFLGAQKVVKTSNPAQVPVGAMVFFGPRAGATTTGGKAGHVAVGAGGGYIYSTDLPTEGKWGKVKITEVARLWGKNLVGYVLVDGMGYTLTDPPVEPAKSIVADWSKPETFVIGATGDQVTKLGERLVVWAKALGLSAPYKSGPGPTFTLTDQLAVQAFQKAQGWTGDDADGLPGPTTLARLAADPPAVVRPANKTAPKALPAGMASMYHVPAGTWYALEDSIPGLEAAHAAGFAWIDMDCHVTKDGVWVFGHWSEMTRDGYTLPAAFTKKYGSKPVIENVTWGDLQTLRTPPVTFAGKKLTGVQYVNAATVFAWLAKHPTMSVAMEMKGTGNALSPGFTKPATFEQLHALAVAAHIDPAKRLLVMSQPPWSNLLAAFKVAHPYFRTAIQRLDWKKPTNWASIEPYVDYYRSGNWGTRTR